MIADDCPSVFAAFAATAERWPDRPLLNTLPETARCYGIEAGEITYAQAAAEVARLQLALRETGYGKGHRVMLLMENRPGFFLWWLALNALGVSVVPINPDLKVTEVSYMIGNAEPVLAIAIPERLEDLREAAQVAGIAMHVAAPSENLPPPRADAALAKGEGADAEAAMLYTSGTTGQPKGCVLTNTYFLEMGRWYATTGGLCALTEEGERMITPLPVFHMNAMATSFMGMVAVGGCLTALDRFHPRSWWASVKEAKATCLHYLGVMPSILMGAEPSDADRDHNVRFGFGAGVDPRLHAEFEARFGFPLVEGWAMTETGAGALLTANRLPRRVGESCLGKPEPWLDIRIVDDRGAAAAQGELLVRRSGEDPRKGFFSEYFKNPDATAEAWEDGWFHTGDIVRQEADGAIFFVDRQKNVIRRSGENIAAVEVESVLMRHTDIAGVAVAAVPDDLRGDEVLACIVAKQPPADPAAMAEQIVQWCLGQMAYYKAPGYVAFVPELPVTATQKLQRATLKALAAELLDDPATVDTRGLKKRSAA